MTVVNTNVAALSAQTSMMKNTKEMESAMAKLSSGSRINTAADDAAGLSISERLESQIAGLSQAVRNAEDAQNMIDTAEGAHSEIVTSLQRLRELAVQAQNGTLQASDKTALGLEFDALEAEITRIADSTSWAGMKILDGSLDKAISGALSYATPLNIQVGTSQVIAHQIDDMDAAALGITSSHSVAQASTISVMDLAINKVSEERAKLGAVSNRLDSTVTNLDQIRVNLTASKGRIEDADFAQETGNLAKSQILQQAATAMVAQANASKSTVLTLLRG